ncbi:glycoside hydrolase family 65 protein [Schumannella sp. 10F1B-5-1]|uniref:glycoside hydrolase family 65 protein n=1 Tax=Schumannella sp. 10F1B-5-1 TaxID=2590780 RepID=UPI0011309188|nr:glycosyl hydrolase family 65 protein [Schumannella sp. 10F1B-5-1]TPW78296.1 glycoside hydrolase family 65 protein [Schumannella sp. 10F1B-5-1]
MQLTDAHDPIDRGRFPLDDWALVETGFDPRIQGRTETLFAVGNGYLGMRGNLDEGRDAESHGSFINGFHETWPIRHAEEAYGFARVGQTIVNVPDAKVVRLYVDDEPFILTEADLDRYTRRLDFRAGRLEREVIWRTPTGKRVRIRSKRMVSFTERHLAVVEYEVTVLDADAAVLLSSQLLNRQDGVDEFHNGGTATTTFDPRKGEAFTDRVLQPRMAREHEHRSLLGYRTTNSGMTIAAAMDHRLVTDNDWDHSSSIGDDIAKQVFRIRAKANVPILLEKRISYHSSRGVPVRELADRCDRTIDRANELTLAQHYEAQEGWLADFWQNSDVAIEGAPEVQQAARWNLFQLIQASARTDGGGIAAKGVSGSGYGGHYFWDTEVYVLPFLSYTRPIAARNALRFREGMLDAARDRAAEMNQQGALFPWRTINGLESSAYYAAGTAQYHIDADIAHALQQYVSATGDEEFLAAGAVDILVETARLWADLGFWRSNGDTAFHIHGVTGPDEYTTVVNDNLYTNLMAKANLRDAVAAVRRLQATDVPAYDRMVSRLGLSDDELLEWAAAADAMHIPYDAGMRIHPQDQNFLEKEVWDLDNTPESQRPLLLHYHPLVIYRHQVLKQADVVLALLLQGHEFTADEKRRDFEYYDALTTGDSTLSAVVQSTIAAEVGYSALALRYFYSAAFVDLADLHRNTSDGIHVASTGGVWTALVYGFAGMRDHSGRITFDPRLPAEWGALEFALTLRGSRIRVRVARESITFTVETGRGADLLVRGTAVSVRPDAPATVALEHHGALLTGEPSTSDLEGMQRTDGSLITTTMPTLVVMERDDEGETPLL